jgi:hypothetical protein
MPKPEITYSLAMSAGRDAGNRSMRKGGQTQWAVKDWNVACETFARLWPGVDQTEIEKGNYDENQQRQERQRRSPKGLRSGKSSR